MPARPWCNEPAQSACWGFDAPVAERGRWESQKNGGRKNRGDAVWIGAVADPFHDLCDPNRVPEIYPVRDRTGALGGRVPEHRRPQAPPLVAVYPWEEQDQSRRAFQQKPGHGE